MSGLYGRLPYLYENYNASLRDVKQVMWNIVAGGVYEFAVEEKPDGQNVFYTFCSKKGLVFARNKTDLKNGGITPKEIRQRWSKKPLVRDSYLFAYEALDDWRKSTFSRQQQSLISSKNVWFSAEVLYSRNPNVIRYDNDAIVLHNDLFRMYLPGNSKLPSLERRPNSLDRFFKFEQLETNKKFHGAGYTVYSPHGIQLKQNSAKNHLGRYDKLEKALAELLPKKTLTIQPIRGPSEDYRWNCRLSELYTSQIKGYVQTYTKSDEEYRDAVSLIKSGFEDQLLLKLRQAKETDSSLSSFQIKIFTDPKLRESLAGPVKTLVNEFAYEAFDGVKSNFLKDDKQHDVVVADIKGRIEEAKANKHKLSKGKQEKLDYHLSQLKPVNTSIEGVTVVRDEPRTSINSNFVYKKSKLVGNFQHINQILGLSRY